MKVDLNLPACQSIFDSMQSAGTQTTGTDKRGTGVMARRGKTSNAKHSTPTGHSAQHQSIYFQALLSSRFLARQDPDRQILLVSTAAIGFLAATDIPAVCIGPELPASPFIHSLLVQMSHFSHEWLVYPWLLAAVLFVTTISTGLGKFANNSEWMDLLVNRDFFVRSSTGADRRMRQLERNMGVRARAIKVVFFLGVISTVTFAVAKQGYC